MIQVSLLIEILRSRPRLLFWLATLAQAALWLLIPALFYFAPPAKLREVLALGHGFQFGAEFGPPLAYWLAEIAFTGAGGSAVGVYLLSQICVVVTYWAVFALGRAIVGELHAVLAILLMAGISAFTVPSPDFGPSVLAMPLWALALLHLWRAVNDRQRVYWYALALDLGLLLLTSHLGLILTAALIGYLCASERRRALFSEIEPRIAAIIVAVTIIPSLVWVGEAGAAFLPQFAQVRSIESFERNLIASGRFLALLLLAHAGTGILIAIASNLTRAPRAQAAVIERPPTDLAARHFVYYFALAPMFAVICLAVIVGYSGPLGTGPLVVLSALAIVTAAGDCIRIYHQRVIGVAWSALLFTPPAMVAAAVLILPWTAAVELEVNQPAAEMGRFFADNFERRIGKRFTVVGGDRRLALLVAVGAPSRPHVFMDDRPGPQPVSREEMTARGAIILWPAFDSAGSPPPEIKARFPEIVPEVPRAFARPIQGRLPLLRVGWALIRPQAAAPERQ